MPRDERNFPESGLQILRTIKNGQILRNLFKYRPRTVRGVSFGRDLGLARVGSMICILDIVEGPARGKRVWVKANQCLEVGRVSTADFSIPLDVHMSRRHLLFDSTQSGFRVRDVGSANGTFLNNHKVQVQELRAGDCIRAGMTTFLVSFKEEDENPHEEDGISFGQSISKRMPEVAADETVKLDVKKPGLRTMDFSQSQDADAIAELKSHASLLPEKSDSDLAATQLNIEDPDWWKAYFKPTPTANLFEQSDNFVALGGCFMRLLQDFSDSLKLCFVVNQSQLRQTSTKIIEELRVTGKIEALSKTLFFAQQAEFKEFWRAVDASLEQDAIVCFGNRSQLNGKDLVPIINSLSFPSMFYQDLAHSSGVARKQISDRLRFAMFESGQDGKIYLWMQGY